MLSVVSTLLPLESTPLFALYCRKNKPKFCSLFLKCTPRFFPLLLQKFSSFSSIYCYKTETNFLSETVARLHFRLEIILLKIQTRHWRKIKEKINFIYIYYYYYYYYYYY
jgi:hypothetical protein